MKSDQGKLSVNTVNEHDLWLLFSKTKETIGRLRNIELAHYGITPEHALVVHLLYNSGGTSTLSQLAVSAMRQHNSMSTLVRRMVKQGLVKREKGPDKQQYNIVLTEKGRQFFEEMPRSSIDMAFTTLSAAEKAQLFDFLNRLQNRARDLLGLDYIPPFLRHTNFEDGPVKSAGRKRKDEKGAEDVE